MRALGQHLLEVFDKEIMPCHDALHTHKKKTLSQLILFYIHIDFYLLRFFFLSIILEIREQSIFL